MRKWPLLKWVPITKKIEGYCKYALPHMVLSLIVAKAHLEGFGGWRACVKEKARLFDFIRQLAEPFSRFDDYDYLHSMSEGVTNISWYGTENGAITGHVYSK